MKGHSDGTAVIRTAGLKGVGIGSNYRAPISAGRMKGDHDYKSDAHRSAFGLRQQMVKAPRQTGLWQRIKDILGG